MTNLSDDEEAVFDFVERNEKSFDDRNGVPLGFIQCSIEFEGFPGFRRDEVVNNVCDSLVEKGFFEERRRNVYRIDCYPE